MYTDVSSGKAFSSGTNDGHYCDRRQVTRRGNALVRIGSFLDVLYVPLTALRSARGEQTDTEAQTCCILLL